MLKKGISVLILIFLAVSLGYFLLLFLGKTGVYTVSFEKDNLKKVVESQIKDSDGRFGIYIKNLKNGVVFEQRQQEEFSAGSIYKLWVMAAVFEKIKKGELKENDALVADVAFLNRKFDLDKEAEFKSGMIEFSIKSAIEQMITISHNYAALALMDRLGSSEDIPERITAKDVALFLEKLYRGEIIDQEYSQKMLDILSRQTINDRIPKYLPEGTRVAHKTGDIGFFENDAGIVFSPPQAGGGDYIIVVLSETKDPAAAGETIAKISQAVYLYFNNE